MKMAKVQSATACIIALAWLLIGVSGELKVPGGDLPRRPEFACNTPAVLSAVSKCGFVGANGTGCCSGLDAVFANPRSPSYGCLCYPPVLYEAQSRASLARIDIMGLLSKCRHLHTNFTTQWASDPHSGCPDLPVDVNAVSLAPFIGTAALTSAKVTPHWSWSNLLQLGDAAQNWAPHVYTILDDLFGVKLVQIIMAVFVALPLVYVAANFVLLRCSGAYRALPQEMRLVAAQHAVYTFIFGLSIVPQTYLTLVVLFRTLTGDMITSKQLVYLLGLFVVPRFALYLLEAGSRSVIKPNAVLVGHRITAAATGLIVVLSRNPGVLPLALLMDLGAAWEAPVYLMLLSRRLQWGLRCTRALLYGSVTVYVLSRVFQIVLLVYMIVGLAGYPAVAATPEFGLLCALYLGYATVGSFTNMFIYRRIGAQLTADDLMPHTQSELQDSGRSSDSAAMCGLWKVRSSVHGKPNSCQPDVERCQFDGAAGVDGAVIVGDNRR